MKKVNAWIARDNDGTLIIYFHARPKKLGEIWIPNEKYRNDIIVLDNESFPAVTFENSPIKIDYKLPYEETMHQH